MQQMVYVDVYIFIVNKDRSKLNLNDLCPTDFGEHYKSLDGTAC